MKAVQTFLAARSAAYASQLVIMLAFFAQPARQTPRLARGTFTSIVVLPSLAVVGALVAMASWWQVSSVWFGQNIIGDRPGLALSNQRGATDARIMLIILGVITIVVGLVLEGTILSQAATSGSNTNIGSFSGAQALNDLVPLIYNAVVVMIGVGMMGVGALGFAGRGPAARA